MARWFIVIVQMCSRSFAYPRECPCCGGTPDDELRVRLRSGRRTVADDTASEVWFPYCRKCIDHVVMAENASSIAAMIAFVGTTATAIMGLQHGLWSGLAVLAISCATLLFVTSLIHARARELCGRACASVGSAVRYLGWSGSTSALEFVSPTYTTRFAQANRDRLVSVDTPLRGLLVVHDSTRSEDPPPARTFDEWLDYVTKQRTRVGRHMALAQALETCRRTDRDRLLDAICQIELLPILVRCDAMTPDAKRRELRRAIEAVRVDNLPEELRDRELRELHHGLGARTET